MSVALQHREITGCEWIDADGGGRTCVWTGECDCGWIGDERHNHMRGGPDKAHSDYKAHVEAALGPQAYYEASVACRNCGSHHRQGVLVGTGCSSAACRECGTRMLQPDNDAWDESREHSKHWGF